MTESERIRRNAISKTVPIAEQDHACTWCNETILRGSKHVKYVIGEHDRRVTQRYHPTCWAEMDHPFYPEYM
jgi:hypothetical protein